MLKEVELVGLLSKVSDVPVVQSVTFILVSVYFLLMIFVKVQRVHTENIRFFKSKNVEQALDKLVDGSDDKALFKELHVQSLFYANTGIDASLNQRKQILDWTTNRGIPISMIKMSWSSIPKSKNGILKAELSLLDKGFFYFSVVTLLWGFIVTFSLASEGVIAVLETGEWVYMLASAIMLILTFIVYLFSRSAISFRRLVYLLEKK
ncbi:MAG: hypothetical protein MI750_11140 [Xanthomonadales bacterium]|nr:hypothetical protein [Xanthomonadales bacterium]